LIFIYFRQTVHIPFYCCSFMPSYYSLWPNKIKYHNLKPIIIYLLILIKFFLLYNIRNIEWRGHHHQLQNKSASDASLINNHSVGLIIMRISLRNIKHHHLVHKILEKKLGIKLLKIFIKLLDVMILLKILDLQVSRL